MAESSNTPRDEDLLTAARLGDGDALDALLRRYQPRVYRFGVKMCGDPEDASDVVQETLLAMAQSVREFRGDASVSTWLYSIARSFCIKKRRRSKFAPTTEDSLDALGPEQLEALADSSRDPEEQAAGVEIGATLDAAITSLDPAQREVLVLRDIEGLTASEVAMVLDVSVEAVKSRLHRARLAVREKVAPLLGIATPATPRPATCPDVLTLFSRHLEGDLAPAACAELETQLSRCAHCNAACQSLKRTLGLCRSMAAPEFPALAGDAVRDAIRAFLAQQRQ